MRDYSLITIELREILGMFLKLKTRSFQFDLSIFISDQYMCERFIFNMRTVFLLLPKTVLCFYTDVRISKHWEVLCFVFLNIFLHRIMVFVIFQQVILLFFFLFGDDMVKMALLRG